MSFKKITAAFVCCAVIFSLQASRHKRKNSAPACGKDEVACKDLNNSCRCFCAFKPGPRDKAADDKPIFIENDPEGNHCYCKERDIKEINRKRAERSEPEIPC